MNLNDILGAVERRKNPKRRGRGEGSGLGKSAGRGNKGAKSRSGWRSRYEYEGGQMPIVRRVPKRGFSNFNFATYFDTINVGTLAEFFEEGATVDLKTLEDRGILKPRFGRLKVLGDGVLAKKLAVVAHFASAEARKKIEAAGGTLSCLIPPRPVRKPRPPKAPKGAPPVAPGKKKKGGAEGGAPEPSEGGADKVKEAPKKDAAPKGEKKEKGGGGKPSGPGGGPKSEAKGPAEKDASKKAGKKGEEKS